MRSCIWLMLLLIVSLHSFSQSAPRTLQARRTTLPIEIDGILKEAAWKEAPAALDYTEFRPTPFKKEDPALKTEVYMLYTDEGIYLGGYCHEKTRDSISAEVNGRDGFGNNDFIGFVFDTYYDKINAFEYFVTPNGEQMDAKMSPNPNGNSEDFTWNAVWKSAAKIHDNGWSFEIFIPFSAIRFSKKNVQDWGFNITRRRQKTGQQYTWNPIDVNVNGFLTQEGVWKGLENIKPPLRLQLYPYVSYYVNHYPFNQKNEKNWTSSLNGGMDVKYGINQALTLDMTLIPDFGQVQSDNRILNLSPFEVKYNEYRPFFTEGTELFNKGGYFYSRRIGATPLHFNNVQDTSTSNSTIHFNERFIKNPIQTKLLNATKISGRTQSGLGIGFLNAIAEPAYAIVADDRGAERKIQTSSLTNYNILVLDQTLKHNSSISFVNTSVTRSGSDYDAYVTAALADLYDKTNTWNTGGKIAFSNLTRFSSAGKTLTGYSHLLYFGKSSGRFNFNVSQELVSDQFNSNDLGYLTNNNYFNHNLYIGYRWTKPKNWYNNIYFNFNAMYSQRYNPLAYQNANINFNFNGQLKNLWSPRIGLGYEPSTNNFYEARVPGRVFKGGSDWFINGWVQTNKAKKYSGYLQFLYVSRSMFNSKRYSFIWQHNYRFNPKFSIGHMLDLEPQTNNTGYATQSGNDIIFGRRDVHTIENNFSVKYSFNSKMVFTARVRHYWSKINYLELFNLQADGTLKKNTSFSGDLDPNYNEFTVDAVLNWQFAPGSFITIVWKNNTNYYITTPYGALGGDNYFKNFNNTMNAPQNNNFSIKIIYFLDYWQLKSKKPKLQA